MGARLTQNVDSVEEMFCRLATEEHPYTTASHNCTFSGDSGYKSEVETRFLSGEIDSAQQLQGMHDALSGAFRLVMPSVSSSDRKQSGGRSANELKDESLEQRYKSAVDHLCTIACVPRREDLNLARPVSTTLPRALILGDNYTEKHGYHKDLWSYLTLANAVLLRKIPQPLIASAPTSTALAQAIQRTAGNNYQGAPRSNAFHLNDSLGAGAISDKNAEFNGLDSLDRQRSWQSMKPPETMFPDLNNNIIAIAKSVEYQQRQVEEECGSGTLKPFNPSYSVLRKLGQDPPRSMFNMLHGPVYNGSSNYQGDKTAWSNYSADIPDDENCSLWVLGLPGNVTYAEFLGAIRDVGKVYICFINSPTTKHSTAAAKLVFFTRSQAEKMLKLMNNGDIFVMGQQITNARWNKIKKASYYNPEHSRAIRITGPVQLMDFGYFEMFFNLRFTYQLDCRLEVACEEPGKVTQEWRFASLRCQAAAAKMAIERELKNIYEVSWAPDPCDVL